MSYLTLEEYNQLGLYTDLTEQQFKKYVRFASAVLDVETRHFYSKHDFETDNPWRKQQFKRALVAQIDYYIEAGAMTLEGLNSEAQSVQVGRTSLSQTSNFNASGANEKKETISHEAIMFLNGTGLLSRGVSNA